MNLKKRLGALLLAAAAVLSLAACGGKPADASHAGASTSDAAPQDPKAQELAEYIGKNLPEEYSGAEQYACEVISAEGGYHAALTLSIDSEGMDEGDMLDMIQLETIHLMSEKLAKAPSPVSYTLSFLLSGGEIATVDKPADSNQCVLTYKGDAANFSF